MVGPRGVVLLLHKRMGMWLQPGGHIDPGETPWDAALRESVEETGLACRFADDPPRLVHVDVHPGPRGHTHLDLRYLVDGGDADPSPPAGESQEVAWFDWDAAIERAGDPRLAAALRVAPPGLTRTAPGYASKRRKTATAFWPPKPKPLMIAVSTRFSRATSGV